MKALVVGLGPIYILVDGVSVLLQKHVSFIERLCGCCDFQNTRIALECTSHGTRRARASHQGAWYPHVTPYRRGTVLIRMVQQWLHKAPVTVVCSGILKVWWHRRLFFGCNRENCSLRGLG